MRKFQFVLLVLLAHTTAFAQGKAFIPEPGEGVSFNTSSLMVVGAGGSFAPAWQANSQEVQLLRETTFGLTHFGLAYGVGYSGHFYHGNLHIDVSADGSQTLQNLDGEAYLSNRLAAEYVDGVLEFRYRSAANNKGRYNRFYVGAIAGSISVMIFLSDKDLFILTIKFLYSLIGVHKIIKSEFFTA